MMAAAEDVDLVDSAMPTPTADNEIKLRSYQEEMLEASLKRNVIVAMETGSGKTHVAIFRILAELETSDPSKLVWFMAPSVALCEQQYQAISTHLSGYLIKTLLGRDGVDKWTDQRLWDAVLTNVRVVVSTPAVLADALSHGFVKMSRLALLVFDEAHNCIKGSPMNTIMAKFYHPSKSNGTNVPHVLGLSASPVMSAHSASLQTIEANLDAQAITPKKHRSELELYVHPPALSCVVYPSNSGEVDESVSALCFALKQAVQSYDLTLDPYFMELQGLDEGSSQRQLEIMAEKKTTFCYKQIKGLRQRSRALLEHLGPLAAEWYVKECMERFLRSNSSDTLILPDLTEKEHKHLASIFSNRTSIASQYAEVNVHLDSATTEKVRLLISLLNLHASPTTRAVVFVEQRAVVHALAYLLRQEPGLCTHFSIGTFVGTSSYSSRASVADLAALKEHQQDLIDFRNGDKNLMIATNVLEEGIDVTACNLVICFDPPKNLISFVQRRGRARQRGSKYVIFLTSNDINADPGKWQALEAEMKQAYMDDERIFVPAEPEDEDAVERQAYRISSTGAFLHLENAKSHLHHFCDVSSSHERAYVDLRPVFDTTNKGGLTPWTAHVQLPSFVHPDLRTAVSSQAWRGEAAAVKDAAFQAYVALHKAGLVNDHLLPLVKDYGPDEGLLHVDQPSLVEVSERVSSWEQPFLESKYEDTSWNEGTLTLTLNDEVVLIMDIWMPTKVPELSFPLYWNAQTTYHVNILPSSHVLHPGLHREKIEAIRHFTRTMLECIHGGRMHSDLDDYPVLLFPKTAENLDIWRDYGTEYKPTEIPLNNEGQTREFGLVRVHGQFGRAFVFSSISTPSTTANDGEEMQVTVTTFPKRRDFLHAIVDRDAQNASYTAKMSFPISECRVDRLPARYSLLAAFVPSIMHRLDIALLVRNIQSTILREVAINHTSLIAEALSSPSANEAADYNRLEFLGDTVLKFCAVLQVLAQHLNWPEGYLSVEKYRLVKNSTLTKAAQEAGLDKFILTKPFTGSKWRPIYVSERLANVESKREMSSKVLADVEEALIGAAFVDGGLDEAFTCIRTLLPHEEWYPHPDSISRLLEGLAPNKQTDFRLLEQLIGHKFRNPTLLLEAITHGSFPSSRTGNSYERLEFLGDAVLDLIIVPKLFAHPRKLRHWELHRVKEAFVSGNFLGYCCMSYGIEEDVFDIEGPTLLEVRKSTHRVHLHDFLRASGQLVKAKRRSLESFERLRRAVDTALESGTKYPWPDLIAMHPQKFLSDIVESILGALYLDTGGDMAVCEVFVEKLGILKHMRRILDEHVETAFPKERLGIWAGGEGTEYIVTASAGEDGKKSFGCTVKVGDEEVASVTGCGSKDEAEARAAWDAVEILERSFKVAEATSGCKRKLDVIMRDEVMTYDGMKIEDDDHNK